jgi:hypothetical protein
MTTIYGIDQEVSEPAPEFSLYIYGTFENERQTKARLPAEQCAQKITYVVCGTIFCGIVYAVISAISWIGLHSD